MNNPARAIWNFLRGEDLKRLPSYFDDPQEQRTYQVPANVVLQKKQAPFGPPGYSPLTGFSFSPGTYNGAPSGVDAVRMGLLVSGPGASDYYRQAQGYGLDGNSAVFACLHTICTAFPEAPARVYKGDAEGGEALPYPDHPLEDLLATPNPSIPAPHMWYGETYAKHAAGDAYWIKVRSDADNVVELWPINPLVMWPVTTEEDARNGIFISYYAHDVGRARPERIEVRDVIHYRMGLHPTDPRHGCSPLQHLVREVAGDEEAVRFTQGLLQNNAVPGLVVTIPPEQSRGFTREKATELKTDIEQAFSGSNRGRVGVLTAGGKLEQFGFTPEQLNMEALHRVPEQRICAVMRTPMSIVGLGPPAQYSNAREERHAFNDSAMVPLYTFDAATINLQLVPDFAPRRRIFVKFDTGQIRALKEDANNEWARYDNAVKTGWITPNEARAKVGLPPISGGDDLAPNTAVQRDRPVPVLPTREDARVGGSSNIIMNPSPNGASRRN